MLTKSNPKKQFGDPGLESINRHHSSRSRGDVTDNKSKEKLHETIALLIDRQNDAQFSENKKNALRNLGITSDAPFSICDENTLDKLKILLDSCSSVQVQAVYAEALRSALSGPGHEGVDSERRRSIVGENRKALFSTSTGQVLLKALVDDFWTHSLKRDFCAIALQCIADDISDLIGERAVHACASGTCFYS